MRRWCTTRSLSLGIGGLLGLLGAPLAPLQGQQQRAAAPATRSTSVLDLAGTDSTTFLVVRVWPRGYDVERAASALAHPTNIAALLERAPRRTVFFGAPPQAVGFFERLGAERGPTGMLLRSAPRA